MVGVSVGKLPLTIDVHVTLNNGISRIDVDDRFESCHRSYRGSIDDNKTRDRLLR